MGRRRGRNKFKYGKEHNAGSSEPWEKRYRKERYGKKGKGGWVGESHRHRLAALKGHRNRKRRGSCFSCRRR